MLGKRPLRRKFLLVKMEKRRIIRKDHRHLGVVPALVVGEDKDDVGRLGQGGRGQAKQQGCSEQVAGCVFHNWRLAKRISNPPYSPMIS